MTVDNFNKNIFSEHIDKICEHFIDIYEINYDNIKLKGKRFLLRYVNSFFRRWLYTALVENTKLSPANVIFEGNGHHIALPVVSNKSKSRIGSMTVSQIDYSIENPFIISDIKMLYDIAENGIKADEDNFYDEEFYKKYSYKFNIDDPDYINYIMYLSLRLGVLKVMPSIGVMMICRGGSNVLTLDNADIFDKIVKEAIKIAAEKMNEFIMQSAPIRPNDVLSWLKNEYDVDTIFSNHFYCPQMSDLIINDIDDYYTFLEGLGFERGIAFDKWFLTPFGYYLGLIMPEYTVEYNLDDEMELFLDVVNFKYSDDYEPSFMLYSPCTSFWLTDVGCKYFNIDMEFKSKYIFSAFSAEKIVDMLSTYEFYLRYDELLYHYYPPFNVYSLRVSHISKKTIWFDIEVSEFFSLDELSRFILSILRSDIYSDLKYRFYTEPESPFTEFNYPNIRKNSNNVYNTYLSNIFENRNTIMYSSENEFKDIDFSFDFRIDLKEVSEKNLKTRVPLLKKKSKKFIDLFYM